MKLCLDCQYFIVNGSVCGHSSAQKPPDYVRGHPPGSYSAATQRLSVADSDCGPDAKHFRTIPIAAVA